MRTRKYFMVGLLAAAGVSLVCWSVLGKDHHDYEEADVIFETPLSESTAEPITTEEEVIADSEVEAEAVTLSIVEKEIIDQVEDEALDEKFAGASAKGTTQAMDITENKNIEGPQKQKEEPKVETITIIEDASDVITIVDDVMDAAEWVDLEDYEIIEVEEEPEEESTYMVVEDMPEYPGGVQALMDFLKENVNYPAFCRENNIQGRVLVSFVVDKDGSVDEPHIEKGVHPKLDEEALRIIGIMPKWKPGTQKGKPVKVKFTVPVNFRLD